MEDGNTITPNTERINKLVLKINALAKRGVEGEREAAKLKLKEIISKYQLGDDFVNELLNDGERDYEFVVSDFGEHLTILSHCIWDVNPHTEIKGVRADRRIYCRLTPVQYIEAQEKFKYYWKHYRQERKKFTECFIMRHQLGKERWTATSKVNTEQNLVNYTYLTAGIDKGEFHKQLENV